MCNLSSDLDVHVVAQRLLPLAERVNEGSAAIPDDVTVSFDSDT